MQSTQAGRRSLRSPCLQHMRFLDECTVLVLLLLSILYTPRSSAADVFNPHAAYSGSSGALACGTYYQDPQCREDCGSCGNACCALQWTISTLSPVAFESALRNLTLSGGPDSLYSFVGSDTLEGYPLLVQVSSAAFLVSGHLRYPNCISQNR